MTRSKTRPTSRPKFKFTDFKFFYALLNSAKIAAKFSKFFAAKRGFDGKTSKIHPKRRGNLIYKFIPAGAKS